LAVADWLRKTDSYGKIKFKNSKFRVANFRLRFKKKEMKQRESADLADKTRSFENP
jgi:hypothetical protein